MAERAWRCLADEALGLFAYGDLCGMPADRSSNRKGKTMEGPTWCAACGAPLKEGFVFSTKDGAFSFAHEVPNAFENAKGAPGFTPITSLKVGGRTSIPAYACRDCRTITIAY